MNKKILVVAVLLLSLILITNVLAITASIGNARMILRAETGDTLEKSILVKNINNVSVNIVLTASGDLQDSITIKDKNFTLQPNEEKNVAFTIKVTKAGTTESKINVQFTPVSGKNGAGLSSTIVVIASGESLDDSVNEDDNNADVNTGDNSDSSDNTSSPSTKTSISGRIFVGIDKKLMAVLLSTLITFIAFIVLLIVYYTKFKKKGKIILTGEPAWKKSRDLLIKQLKECDSSDEFLKIINSAASSMKLSKEKLKTNNQKAKRGKSKPKKRVKKRG